MSGPEVRIAGRLEERSAVRPRARTRDIGDNCSGRDSPTDRKVAELSPMSLACVRQKYKFDPSYSLVHSPFCAARARDIGDSTSCIDPSTCAEGVVRGDRKPVTPGGGLEMAQQSPRTAPAGPYAMGPFLEGGLLTLTGI